jgi:hypothetical protein
MSENINWITAILELAITFSGVFLAFTFDRIIDRRKENHAKKDLLRNLCFELNELKSKLTGAAYRLYPDIWDSAIASGQLSLLSSEQITKLTKVYSLVKGTDYEAIRVRDAEEAFKSNNHPTTMKYLRENWEGLSLAHFKRMEATRTAIDNILKEKLWD